MNGLKLDSNPLHNDLNLYIWSYEKQVKVIRIFELQIRIPSPKMKLKVKQKDLNFRVMDLNLSLVQNSNFTKAIRISYTAIQISFSAEALNARPTTPTT